MYNLLVLEMTRKSKSKLCYFLDVQSKCFTVQGMLCCHNSSFLTWKHRTFCTLTGAYTYVVFESVAFPCSIPDEYGISDMTVNLTEKDICSGRLDSTQWKIFHIFFYQNKLDPSQYPIKILLRIHQINHEIKIDLRNNKTFLWFDLLNILQRHCVWQVSKEANLLYTNRVYLNK